MIAGVVAGGEVTMMESFDPEDIPSGSGMVRVVLSGDIDLATIEAVRVRVDRALAAPGVSAVEIDLGAVTFLDSTGIGVLVAGRHSADALGVGFRVTRVPSRVRSIFDLVGVAAFLHVDNPEQPDTAV